MLPGLQPERQGGGCTAVADTLRASYGRRSAGEGKILAVWRCGGSVWDMSINVELVADARAHLGEGPLWWEDTLWCVDIDRDRVGRVNPVDGAVGWHDVGQKVGAVVPRSSGGFVLAAQGGFAFFDPEGGVLDPIADPEADFPDNRFNDGKCDPRGRFVAGTMGLQGKNGGGALYVLDTDRSVRRLFGDVTVSNGLAWTEDGLTMYYIDTPTREIAVFDYDLDAGTVSGRRVCVSVPRESGGPDGMTIDRNGNLWVALWGGWAVGCWDPRTGELLEKVDVPAANVTSCCFGGPNLDRLYITTAGGPAAGEDSSQPRAGGVFVCDPGVSGWPAVSFAG